MFSQGSNNMELDVFEIIITDVLIKQQCKPCSEQLTSCACSLTAVSSENTMVFISAVNIWISQLILTFKTKTRKQDFYLLNDH